MSNSTSGATRTKPKPSASKPKSSASQPPSGGLRAGLDRFFKISERGSTLGREIRGGLVSFFAMSYIVVLNPIILGGKDATGHYLGGGTDGPNTAMIAAATALVAGVMTIIMGVTANYPLVIAAGLGLNAVVAFSIATAAGTGGDMTWQDAMGLVVISGIFITILVVTGFRQAVFRAVPDGLKTAISVGIGLFIALIGFINAGFVRIGGGTPLSLGIDGHLTSWPLVVFILGLLLVFILMMRKVKGALLISIVASTIVAVTLNAFFDIGTQAGGDPHGWTSGAPSVGDNLVSMPDFSLLGQFNLLGGFQKLGIVAALMFVFSIMLADFFDTMGTMVAVGKEGKLLDSDGVPLGANKILVVDALACVAGGMGSVSSNTAYVESATGVAEGARTGFANVVTGVCLLLATFLAPLVSLVPAEAAASALVVVGFLMLSQIADLDWKRFEIAVPAFLTIVAMPFTYSITVGMGIGFVSYTVLMVFAGKAKKIHPLMWVVAAMFIVYFVVGN